MRDLGGKPTISQEEEDKLGKKAQLWVGENGTRDQEIGQELVTLAHHKP